MAFELEVGEVINEHSVLRDAGDPQRLLVGRNAHAVRRRVEPMLDERRPVRQLRILDHADFFLLCEVDHADAIEFRYLHEDALGRAVRIGFRGHRAHALAEVGFPGDLFLGQVDHGEDVGAGRAHVGILAVGRDIDVVQAPVGLDALGACQRLAVDDFHRARVAGDCDHDAAVLGYCEVVGVAAELDLLDELIGLGVVGIDGALGLVGDVDELAVRRAGHAVGGFDALEMADRLVGGRIDDIDVVTAAVGLINAHRIG